MKLFVEGGGNSTALKAECREGFKNFITKAGVQKRPRIVACGSRSEAYNDFCTAIKNNEEAMLLVDSEEAVAAKNQNGERSDWLPWGHLSVRKGDQWSKPNGSADGDCHMMTQVMETWFLADRTALAQFFGNGFKVAKLPAAARSVETVSKGEVYQSLKDATSECKTKAQYGKGAHSFKILSNIDPDLVIKSSPWAARFIDALKEKMD